MRSLILSSVLLSTSLLNSAFAATNSNNDINYNVVNIQAEANRKVSNDEMHAVMFIEKTNKQPAQLSSEISQLMNQAQALARKYPQIKVDTGSQTTYPVYDNDNQKLKEWRGRAEINIESKDFKAASQLISELQQNFQTQAINFTVSDEQRIKVENELIVEASKNFQQRAQIMSNAWNKSGYNLVNLNINTNRSYPQPIMGARVSMAKFAADSAPAQEMAAGESTITVSANGSVQFK
ncbi:SIMPL domain-containing protein [Acinetobacter gerneri]|uniref:DUF541 domain-containing protein n=1 Tax=Acinetobacter gerneri DSM 14967 = CIP 107464 = MTCC 9824 TaxID=1120926 RepID=N8YBN0_9GAMM|nr:SIMPL domain-containing protein [Acinetobacter gerneri]ENV34026.1 hypothetical protein F960_01716 [Acinetobacter gerneri DSM 14967 = CIP 107464 = MTCC 9824]EPR84152.1 putative signal peptide protein [Acinetobacter gerneri DSM 14967 = CIP 107464 = MTCC 9824]